MKRFAILGLVASLATVHFAAPTARAQATGSKVAVVDMRKVLDEITEYKDVKVALEAKQKSNGSAQDLHKATLTDLQNKINVFVGSEDAHDDLVRDLDNKSLQFKLDDTKAQVELVREQAKALVGAYKHMQIAVAEIAKRKGFDIVLTTTGNDLPDHAADNGNIEQLVNQILGRNVLYSSENVNLTAEVITVMNASYSKPRPAAPAVPAGR